jgi:hypothetical protein
LYRILVFLFLGRSITWRISIGFGAAAVSVVTPLQDEDNLWKEDEDWEVEEWGDEWDDFGVDDDW